MDESNLNVLWWEARAPKDVHESAVADFDTLRDISSRQDRFATWERIYRNEDIDDSETLAAELLRLGVPLSNYSRASYNLIATATDNITSRIIRSKPRAIYQVEGGNWSRRRVARMQQKWTDYVAHSQFFNRVARTQVRDGVLLGVGHSKVFKKAGVSEIDVCHVHSSDVFVDSVEVTYGTARRMFQRQFCSKDAARRMFGGKKTPDGRSADQVLTDAGIMSDTDWQNRSDRSEAAQPVFSQVEIVEAWHLPTYINKDGSTSGDDRHIIFCSEGLLYDGPWKRSDFPILSYQWKGRPGDSFHGISVPEEIIGIHLDLNFSLQMVYESAEVTGSPIILSPQAANMSKDEFSDLPGQVWEYSGSTPPTVVQPPKVQVDLLALVDNQEARAYRRLGLDSASPNEPSKGLETGRAVRMDFDARSMAFANALQNWECLYEDFGNKAVATGRQIWEQDKSFSVVVPRNKYTIEDVPWEDVSLDPRTDSWTVKVTAGSQLSQHPAGRIDDVANMVNMGAVTEQTEKRALMNLSDLEHSNSLATATRDAVEQMCEEMLDDGIEHSPEPYDDLDLCLSIANAQYLIARSLDAPEDRLDLMRGFLDRTTMLISERDVERAAQAQRLISGGATPPAPDEMGQNPAAVTDVQS